MPTTAMRMPTTAPTRYSKGIGADDGGGVIVGLGVGEGVGLGVGVTVGVGVGLGVGVGGLMGVIGGT